MAKQTSIKEAAKGSITFLATKMKAKFSYYDWIKFNEPVPKPGTQE